MAFVQKKKTEGEFEGVRETRAGLGMDLGLMVCPECRREVPNWRTNCEECGHEAVPKAGLAPAVAPPPAHLLTDVDDDELDKLIRTEDDLDDDEEWEYVDDDAEEEEGYIYVEEEA